MDVERNPTMFGGNRLKLAVFGSNCSSGRAATTVSERWQNTFEENIRLAQMADAAGLEALVPIGRWKGYGGATNFEGSTFETITWACGLLAATQRLTVFGTVHVPLFPPVLAAKQIVTADHIRRGTRVRRAPLRPGVRPAALPRAGARPHPGRAAHRTRARQGGPGLHLGRGGVPADAAGGRRVLPLFRGRAPRRRRH